jgi:hypothetical protein
LFAVGDGEAKERLSKLKLQLDGDIVPQDKYPHE